MADVAIRFEWPFGAWHAVELNLTRTNYSAQGRECRDVNVGEHLSGRKLYFKGGMLRQVFKLLSWSSLLSLNM